MTTNKTKKVHKYRAHTTHGGGHRKKRRGAGSRGGVGNAGSGKRASHKRNGKVLGAHGFNPRRSKKVVNAINLGYFTSSRLNKLLDAGKATKEGDSYNVDLDKLGFNKLLSTGKINNKVKFNVDNYSANVEEKVNSAGGEIVKKKEVSKEAEKKVEVLESSEEIKEKSNEE